MPGSEIPVTLETIGGGAARERFAEEWDKVLENIADPNTDPEKKRTITIEVTVFPNKARDAADVTIASSRKLAPVTPADATVFFGKVNGRRVAVEHDPKQGNLFDDESAPKGPKAVPLRATAGEGES